MPAVSKKNIAHRLAQNCSKRTSYKHPLRHTPLPDRHAAPFVQAQLLVVQNSTWDVRTLGLLTSWPLQHCGHRPVGNRKIKHKTRNTIPHRGRSGLGGAKTIFGRLCPGAFAFGCGSNIPICAHTADVEEVDISAHDCVRECASQEL